MSQSQPPQKTTISPKEAKKALWKKGNVSWKLDANQKTIYEALTNSTRKIDVVLASRQQGKSFMLSVMAIEYCLKNPNSMVKMIAPQVSMIKRIIRPVMREILIDCPEELQPKQANNEHIIRFQNGSEIQLAGTDGGNADSIRGTKAHLCIVDEAGFCDDLDYIIKSILIPTTTTTKGRIILSSTPPKNNDHEFCKFWQKAEEDGVLIKRTIYDNPRLTEEDIEILAEAVGGKTSIGFRREYLCQKLTSADAAVVPEFTEELEEKIVKVWPRPAYYDAYAAMDIGVTDLTVVLFAYYDYRNAKIIIEDELVENGKTLLADKFGEAIQEKESKLWVNPMTGEPKTPFIRISDNNNPQFLNQIYNSCGVLFLPTAKLEAEAALNQMRQLIRSERVIINPRCKVLISHLKNAIWNKSRTSYVRSRDTESNAGHFDAVDSLKYLCRNINFNKDPYPASYQVQSKGDIFFSDSPVTTDKFGLALIDMFKVKKPKKLNK